MRLWIVALALIVGSPALSCSCPPPRNMKAEDVLAWRLDQSQMVATVRVSSFTLVQHDDDDPVVSSDATVVRVLKGKIKGLIKIVSSGGDEGANCGLASMLFQAASERRLITLSLGEDPDLKDTFATGSCGYVVMGEYRSALN